jgi:hypothetical protein
MSTDLGYPQLPTLLLIDNIVAIGLTNDTINKKRSKSMDMRFIWLRDRVRQQQFVVEHIPGQHNVADFFTKALPKSKFDQFHRYLVVNRESLKNKRPKKEMKTITMDETLRGKGVSEYNISLKCWYALYDKTYHT